MVKIAIVGSRNYHYLSNITCLVSKFPEGTVIVSGGAKGPDMIGELAAYLNGFSTEIYIPEWEKYGRSAGFKRNKLIIDAADSIFAFYDGRSKGTLSSIKLAQVEKKELFIMDDVLYSELELERLVGLIWKKTSS